MIRFIRKFIPKLFKYSLLLILLIFVVVVSVNYHINSNSSKFIERKVSKVPECYTALVLGAFVYRDGTPSYYLKDRLDAALKLYKSGKVKRFLLSGDHGTKSYDEVNNMKTYLMEHGIKQSEIFLDHAGFDTYDSMVRAKKVFGVDDVIIVTQEFHLPRAVYIARKKGLNAYGLIADKTKYRGLPHLKMREKLAKVKAFMDVTFNSSPKFLGKKIPIKGNSRLSYD